jgi:CheY-like chemotaxis protein
MPSDGAAGRVAQRYAARDAAVRPLASGPGRPHREPPRLDGTTVLFVEDQSESREWVSLLLDRSGAKVVAVETAEQAMTALTSAMPDVLISDIALPGEDGYALIRRVRALEGSAGVSLPAIALTACAGPEDRRRAKHEGFQVHLAKPVEPDELLELVATLGVRRA